MKPKILIFLLSTLLANFAQAKSRNLDERWSFEVPDDWWYAETQDIGALRVYTFGLGTPDTLPDAPVFLVDRKMEACVPELVRGISLGIARVPMEPVTMKGTEELVRKESWLGHGYRKKIDTATGPLFLNVFLFFAEKLPGEPLPNSDMRWVMVHIAGQTEGEVEQFTKIFEALGPWAPK